ncbi:hypothetical protein O1611_g7629 [Lasiodiplodia mahajangana]|uniref:Uncharacterized protein n=1 Tax=Lasiodiplodia mahajangana TaxID=1108764 RepID=A0ACC2JFM3_9PEZI|nr:hypothetical protein O1611_g7629 [Lasiodiplodia mahajangana]
MVSFFGLKIGGEKKKSSRDLQISAPKPRNLDLDDSNAIDSNFFDFKGGPTPSYEASVYSLSRQESGQSTLSIASKFRGFKKAPIASNGFGSSMVDLPTPPSLRHHASNPSLGRRWNTGSSTSLSLAPPSFNPLARPSTSDGKNKTWVNPLDVHFARDSSKSGFKGPLSPASTMRDDGQPITPLSATPKSPLGQYELKLDLPSDVSSFADFSNFNVEAPTPLRIKKPASTRLAAETRPVIQSPQKPPSPPQSITDKEASESVILEPPPKLPVAEKRPQSAHSHRSIPSGFEELHNVISKFGPASLPSPSTTPRASEEKPPTISMSSRSASPHTKRGSAKPVIKNVRAKRDTLTINPQRRRSLQMKIEAAEGNSVPSLSLVDRPKTSGNGRLVERPPPLTLNTGFHLSASSRDGPRSAPFLLNPTRSLTPTGVKSPLRPQMGAQDGSNPSALASDTNEQLSRPDSPSGSSVYDDDDDDMYHHPPSPESTSPVIPLSGPLASPRFPPSSPSPHSYASTFTFPRRDEGDTDLSLSPTTPPVPPRSLRRNLPTPDSSYWPLPSPAVHSFDRSAMTPSPADSRLRSESGSESLSIYEPLDPPRIPASRSESPTFRSFSRPWTPTTTGEFTAPSLRRAETTGPLSSLGPGGEFGGGLRPPPRSVTVKTPRTEIGALKSPSARVGGNSLGTC